MLKFSSEEFVTATKEKLGFKVQGREVEVVGRDASFKLKKPPAAYRGILRYENVVLRPQNQNFWEDTSCISA